MVVMMVVAVLLGGLGAAPEPVALAPRRALALLPAVLCLPAPPAFCKLAREPLPPTAEHLVASSHSQHTYAPDTNTEESDDEGDNDDGDSLFAHCLIPPLLSSFLHAFRMITPAQYWMSCGRLGGGFGNSSSDELCRYVNRSTSANTFVIRGGLPDDPAPFAADVDEPAPEPEPEAEARSFSFPRPVALLNAFTNAFTSLPTAAEPALELPDPAFARLDEPEEDADDGPARASLMSCAVAGWKLVRGL